MAVRLPLDVSAVTQGLVMPGQPWRGVEFHRSLGSTNARARELVTSRPTPRYAAGPGEPPPGIWWVVLTDDQTEGRGRLGRTWEVPPRASISLSAVVPVDDLASVGWVPLLAGLALARAIREITASSNRRLEPVLKWPNDVLLADDGDRKVAGILCELVALPTGHAVVVGTGVNVDQTREELPVDMATSLALAGAEVAREHLVVAYLHQLSDVLGASGPPPPSRTERIVRSRTRRCTGAFETERFVRSEYRGECVTIGARVRLHLPSGAVVEGTATDVDDSGALVVQSPQGRRAYAAGDVVHVRRGGRLG